MVSLDEWSGLLENERTTEPEVVLRAPLEKHKKGGSGSFKGLGTDGNRYWIKPLNNNQDPRVIITEQIVARAGEIISAPCCPVRLIGILDDGVM